MPLHINGEQREFPDGLTVAALVGQLGMKPDRVAVELNLEIVPRTQWEATTLKTATNWKSFILSAAGPARDQQDLDAPAMAVPQESAKGPGFGSVPLAAGKVSGAFCPNCGEKKPGPHDFSLHHFFTHALGEFFHFDSKIFRSFRLLFTTARISCG